MNQSKQQIWERLQKCYADFPAIELSLDFSRINIPEDFFSRMGAAFEKAFSEMAALEKGAIANPDENRMVGHYWLRNPALAPTAAIRREIEETLKSIKDFAARVHSGAVSGEKGPFKNLLLIGIGGSALGPQFVSRALGHPKKDKLRFFSFDNTDPDGMDAVLAAIEPDLGQTLCIVISKSGGTKETRNGMLEAKAAYDRLGLKFGSHVVAVTQPGSELDKFAVQNGWLARFPMWDWVGGRTSELSAVGLLPAALQGIDIDQLLAGAKACDETSRTNNVIANPSALLAAAWYVSGNGKGSKNVVVLPYKDRLELFSKYLQQLIMESLGKKLDRDGKVVHQGLTVLGNKGSTDQHSYVQQLRDGLSNIFVIFIEVLKDRAGTSIEVEPGIGSGDFLHGLLLGTRQALYEEGRESITLTIASVTPSSVGVLIALFERAVGLYASLINVNAYHQPGVEAGKKAAAAVIELETRALACFSSSKGQALTVRELATRIGADQELETLFKICEHLAANQSRSIEKAPGRSPFEATYRAL